MARKNYIFGFFAAIVAAIILNGFLTLFLMRSKDYVSVDKTVMSRALYSEAEKILFSCDGFGYQESVETLEKQIEDLKTYRRIYEETGGGRFSTPHLENRYTEEQLAEIFTRHPYTDSTATARIGMLEYCVKRLQRAMDYPDYVKKVIAEAEVLAGMKIYDDAAKRRIIRTGARFYGFENIRVSAEPELGAEMLLDASLWDWVSVVMAFVCALLYYLHCHALAADGAVSRSRVWSYALFFWAGNVLLYVTGAYVSNTIFGVGDLHRAVQSLGGFYSCPYMMSVGMLLALCIGVKSMACTVLYLFFVGLLFCGKRWKAAMLIAAAVFAEFLTVYFGAGIRFGTAFHVERLVTEYVGVPLFGETVGAGWVLAVLLVVLLTAAFAFSGRQVSAALLREKERQEHLYFEEIDHKYTEARYIRHDINNHLTALALLMDAGKLEDARQYLDKVFEKLDEVRTPVKTGSSVLDAVLFGKVKAAEGKGIEVKLDFSADFAGSGISDYDLCSVFSNLLDNATEACGKLPDGERRVDLRVKRQGQMICVFCENRYLELKREGRGFATVKSDRAAHGLGLKRILSIAEKYHGSVEICTEGEIFSIAVLFQNNGI